MHIHRHVYVLAWSLCLRWHCWGDSWLFSPSVARQKVGCGAVGKEAGILLMLPGVQLKTGPEPSLSLIVKTSLQLPFFPVSNNPFVFTHSLPEMSCFLFAWQTSLWPAREGALCTSLWGLFHHLLPSFSIWNGFWLLLSSVVPALAPPSVLSSSACEETSSSLRAVLGLCQPVTQPGAGGMNQELTPNCQISVQHRTERCCWNCLHTAH